MNRIFSLFLMCCFSFLPLALPAQTDEAAQIMELDKQMMAALGAQDTAAIRDMLLPEADLVAVTFNHATNAFSVDRWLENIASSEGTLEEITWDEQVQVSGPIAVLWAPYEFRVDGEFHHCGVNVVNFVKTEAGWKAAKITFSVMREGCEKPQGK